jgi:hypothetical protein
MPMRPLLALSRRLLPLFVRDVCGVRNLYKSGFGAG